MQTGGRPAAHVWVNFDKVHENGMLVGAKCVHCTERVSPRVRGLNSHIKRCLVLSLKERNNHTGTGTADTLSPCTQNTQVHSTPTPDVIEVIGTANKKRKVETKLDSFLIRTPTSVKTNLDMAWAKAFYACGLPFSVIDQPLFREAVSLTRPGYEPPTCQQLAEKQQDKVFEKVTQVTLKDVETYEVILTQE